MTLAAIFAGLWLASPASAFDLSLPALAPDAEIFEGMQAEMNRSLKKLKVDSFGPPYFLAYRLVESDAVRLVSSYGATVRGEREEERRLYVEARVGDESFDNTDLTYHGKSGSAALDAKVLRHNLWNLTDEAYKAAVAGFLEKKAKKATELDREKLDDLSREPAYTASLPNPSFELDGRAVRQLVQAASAQFKRWSWIQGSYAYLEIEQSRRWLLTSEGTRIASPYEHAPVVLILNAWARADDGMRIDSRRSWAMRTPKDLPALDVLLKEGETLAKELKGARDSAVQAPVSAPAILDPEVAGVFFHEALGHKLEGQRQRDPNESQVFKDQVGAKIIPEFLSLVDDPTMPSWEGEALHGHYAYDDEGVPAQRVTLVERGVLKGFLMSRWPVKGVARSNGHGRADAHHHPSGRMANLMIVAHEPVPKAELKARLMALAKAQGKPFGFLLVGSSGGENPNNRRAAQTLEVRPRLIYRIDAESGEETPVRGVKLVGTPLVVLNRITAAGDDSKLSNPFNCGAESGQVPVDQISPSLLVSNIELQRVPEERARPPLLPSPFHDRD
ncbi:MAG: TldD/PmbA family protein [Elusimicrobia bacterium]|nr:TldD/PmbA family protein [Elusimicrobiota bacterium]